MPFLNRASRERTRFFEPTSRYFSRRDQSKVLRVESLEPRFTPAGHVIALTLHVVSDSGTPLAAVYPGQYFKVQVFVQDLRDDYFAKGAFSAFTDILFDADIIEPVGDTPITFGQDYRTVPTGDTNTAGVVNELGALATNVFSKLDNLPHLLAEVQFHAKRVGNPELRLDPPDQSINETLLFDSADAGFDVDVVYGTSSFEVDEVTRLTDISQVEIKPRISKSTTTHPPIYHNAPESTELQLASFIHALQSNDPELHGALCDLSTNQAEIGFLFASSTANAGSFQEQPSNLQIMEQNTAYFATDFKDPLVTRDELIRSRSTSLYSALHSESVATQTLNLDNAAKVAESKNIDPSGGFQVEQQVADNRREILPIEAATDRAFVELDTDYFPILDVRLSGGHSVIY